jgi:catechol 2,3-dioxygenase-like lactoylglutathione lyase family enzyme
MLHYASLKVADLQRTAAFYDALLAPLGWRRQAASGEEIGWGINRPGFFAIADASQRPGFGIVSFPAKSIPAVKASFESGVENGGEPVAEPGSAPMFGVGNYACRLHDPDGYLVEICVAHD